MNNQPEGVGNRSVHTDNGEDPPLGGAGEEQSVPRTLLDYTAPRATKREGLDQTSLSNRRTPSYSVSTISILQNNCYHGLEHKDPHDHIKNFLQCLGAVRPNAASEDYIRLAHFPFTLKDKAKR